MLFTSQKYDMLTGTT